MFNGCPFSIRAWIPYLHNVQPLWNGPLLHMTCGSNSNRNSSSRRSQHSHSQDVLFSCASFNSWYVRNVANNVAVHVCFGMIMRPLQRRYVYQIILCTTRDFGRGHSKTFRREAVFQGERCIYSRLWHPEVLKNRQKLLRWLHNSCFGRLSRNVIVFL